ncbi:MAG TPA: sodium:proton antiporter [Prevotellaceae bacterium]|nr:sodium:proton antiporter [Prevotellaceae bacterium]
MDKEVSNKRGLLSLSPLLVFLLAYFALSLLAGDFYAVPITVAFLIACGFSLLTMPGLAVGKRFQVLVEGAGRPGLMTMIWIFILAGAFASTAKQAGAIDSTVSMAVRVLPSGMILCGVFLAACFISLSVGTSVGTIAALTPIAGGMAQQAGYGLPLMVAIVVGGAFFGDNLSFISDTTIMATKTQGCGLRDKFRSNVRIAVPAAMLCIVLYLFIGNSQAASHAPVGGAQVNYLLVIPYIYILLAALCGMDVMLVLATGTLMSGILGMSLGRFDLYGWFHAMNDGVMGMGELIVVTMLAGGLVESMRRTGGITYAMRCLSRHISGARGAELCIAALVVFTDICTANNTIAILTVGPIAREISARFHVDPRRAASILDTFSCFAQGLIPYGAQMLIAAGLARVSPLQIMPYLYYPYILGAVALLYIIIQRHEKEDSIAASVGTGMCVHGQSDR